MAEGGDVVDSGQKYVCNICEQADLSVPAKHFCVSCEQYLCGECKIHHSRVKATKSHQVIGTDEIPTLTSLTLGSEAMETPVCTEHERPFEYFCVRHMAILCITCKLLGHKACGRVIELEKAACDVFSEGHSRNILKSMEELIDSFSKCKDTAQSNRDGLYKSKQSEMDKVKQTRITIDNHLDKIEAAAYKDIHSAFTRELNQVDDKLHVCDVSIFQLKKRISKLERAMELGDKESEFVTINNVTKEINRQCTLLKDTTEDTCDIDFTFIVSDSIGKITQLLPSLGTVFVTPSPASQSDPGTVLIYTGELKPRTATDTKDPEISSYEKLPDGRQLITDCNNNKLKLYDPNNQFLSELTLPDMPVSVVSLSDTKAVVSLPNINTIQYITIGTDLAVSETKNVNYEPWAMVKYGDDILATVHDSLWKIAAIDNHGAVKRTIYQDNGSLFSKPRFIGLSVDQKTVYIVDIDKGCIGLSMEGNIVFQYQDQKVKLYAGLAVGRDRLSITVNEGNDDKVRRLSLSGDDAEDLDLGLSMPLKIMDNHLIIYNVDDKGECFIKFFYLL